MSQTADFLFELGCEELPPKALPKLEAALAEHVQQSLQNAGLSYSQLSSFATPRRLAIRIEQLLTTQPDQQVEKLGPNVKAAYDKEGKPSKAAEGFARSCGVAFDELETITTDKGDRLVYRATQAGQSAKALLPGFFEQALKALPIPKRMRWGSHDVEFVRPIHWLVMLLGDEVIDTSLLNIQAGNRSQGHRFHSSGELTIDSPMAYEQSLLDAYVIADFATRRDKIQQLVEQTAKAAKAQVAIDAELLDEVTALVEWPVPVIGQYGEHFLALPPEVIISTIQEHQRYFPVLDADGKLNGQFITVANIESREPEQVVIGNERVVRPRLEDALFFWNQDQLKTLAERIPDLDKVVFEHSLGSQKAKTERVAGLSFHLSANLNGDKQLAQRAAELSRSDLLTHIVYEIPEMQGIAGKYYAELQNEPAEVASALAEMYKPGFAGDDLPETQTGTILALADRLDTLAGIFSIGKKPTGDKDPFALRRAALGILRIVLEKKLNLDLAVWIDAAVRLQPEVKAKAEAPAALNSFMQERLRMLFKDAGERLDLVDACLAVTGLQPLEVQDRLTALNTFMTTPAAGSLAAANKRINNLLSKQSDVELADFAVVNSDAAEAELAQTVLDLEAEVEPVIAAKQWPELLDRLSRLQGPVDQFFDQVMVMSDDPSEKNRRLAILARLRALFLTVADFALIQ